MKIYENCDLVSLIPIILVSSNVLAPKLYESSRANCVYFLLLLISMSLIQLHTPGIFHYVTHSKIQDNEPRHSMKKSIKQGFLLVSNTFKLHLSY